MFSTLKSTGSGGSFGGKIWGKVGLLIGVTTSPQLLPPSGAIDQWGKFVRMASFVCCCISCAVKTTVLRWCLGLCGVLVDPPLRRADLPRLMRRNGIVSYDVGGPRHWDHRDVMRRDINGDTMRTVSASPISSLRPASDARHSAPVTAYINSINIAVCSSLNFHPRINAVTNPFFTARCYAKRSIATANRPSVSNVEISWSHWLEYFENYFMAE